MNGRTIRWYHKASGQSKPKNALRRRHKPEATGQIIFKGSSHSTTTMKLVIIAGGILLWAKPPPVFEFVPVGVPALLAVAASVPVEAPAARMLKTAEIPPDEITPVSNFTS